MADALCGPSNALQSFKQHTSVDRTLQQDRLVSRAQPGSGFRSHDLNAGLLDPEFEAFQAGPPLVLPNAFSAHHIATPQQHFPSRLPNTQSFEKPYPAPLQSSSWASDFQNLHLSSPPPAFQHHAVSQQDMARPVQFQQQQPNQDQLGIHDYHHIMSEHQNHGPLNFTAPQHHHSVPSFSQPHLPASAQAHQADFDEAAFNAAFDAAMEDAALEHVMEVDATPTTLDPYPYIPLFRVALLKAIMDPSDHSLHEAAILICQLLRHSLDLFDPTQAMLLRPLVSRLADQSRSPFAARYDLVNDLEYMDRAFQRLESDARISPGNEQLLAAYADCLWGRDDSNHLRSMDSITSDSDASKNRTMLRQQMDTWTNDNIGDGSIRMLRETNLYGLPLPPDMRNLQRVVDMEVDAMSTTLDLSQSSTSDPTARQEALFHALAAATRSASATEYNRQLHLLEQQNKKRLDLANLEQQKPNQEERERAVAPEREVSDQTPLEAYQSQLRKLEALNRARLERERAEKQQKIQKRQQEQQDRLASPSYSPFGLANEQPVAHLEPKDSFQQLERQELLDQQEQEQEQDQPTEDDDALANTAADLLDKVAHDKSDKFQNSTFLSLMRKLADRQVKVEGDNMVETGKPPRQERDTTHPAVPSSWSQAGPMQASTSTSTQPQQSQQPQLIDGQDVVNLLNQPGDIFTEQQDEEAMMSSPFAMPDDLLDHI